MTTASSLDGRTARKLANRDRILDAALELAAEGADVDFDTIADRSGVSVRSVYNHFPTARDLIAGMYQRGTDNVAPLLAEMPSPADPFPERLTRWVRVWARIQEEIAPIRWRALHAESEHPELQPELAELRAAHAREIRRMFPEVQSEASRHAVIAMTDSLAWRALRKHQKLSVEAACEVVEETIRRMTA